MDITTQVKMFHSFGLEHHEKMINLWLEAYTPEVVSIIQSTSVIADSRSNGVTYFTTTILYRSET